MPTLSINRIKPFFYPLGQDIYDTSLTLFKIMIPAVIIVKIAQELGGIDLLARFIEPLMNGLGLPEEMGLVWAMTIATNLYGGILFAWTLHQLYSTGHYLQEPVEVIFPETQALIMDQERLPMAYVAQAITATSTSSD